MEIWVGPCKRASLEGCRQMKFIQMQDLRRTNWILKVRMVLRRRKSSLTPMYRTLTKIWIIRIFFCATDGCTKCVRSSYHYGDGGAHIAILSSLQNVQNLTVNIYNKTGATPKNLIEICNKHKSHVHGGIYIYIILYMYIYFCANKETWFAISTCTDLIAG